MARLPVPGADDNVWGDVLNEYLSVAHNNDGTLKSSGVLLVASSTAPSDVQNVADYVCDGTSDEDEINTALTAASSSAQTVRLSSGIFTIDGSITIPADDVMLVGDGSGATTIRYSGSNGSDSIVINDKDDVLIKGLALTSTSGNGCGVHVTSSLNVRLEDILADGMGANHGATGGFPWSWGQIYIDESDRAFLRDVSAVSSDTARGIFVQSSDDVRIEGGLTQLNSYEGIYIDDCERSTVVNVRSGNNGTNAGGPVTSFATNLAYLESPHATIIGGELFGHAGSDKDNAGSYGENNLDLYECDYATVVGTRVHNSKDSNVYVQGSSYVRLIGLDVYQANQRGIVIVERQADTTTTNAAMIVGVSSQYNNDNGLRVTTENASGAAIYDVHAIGCFFTNNDNIGVLAEAGSHNVYLENCDLTGNGGGNNGWWYAFGTGEDAVSFRACKGPTTFNQGTGTITNGNTSVTVTHGLSFAPHIPINPTAQDFTVTPTNNPDNAPGHIWVSNVTATQFTVNCASDPGASGLTFAWVGRTRQEPNE